MNNYDFFINELIKLENENLLRHIKNPFIHKCSYIIEYKNKNLINLTSNDYLGFAFDKDLYNEFFERIKYTNIDNLWFASSGSRLLSGNSFPYEILEENLSKLYKNRCCIIFNSGYHANTGIIPSFANSEDVIFFDKLCHASIIDGILLSKAKYFRYNHLDYNHLEHLLKKYRNNFKKSFIITESVFSMDGDTSDLKILLDLKTKYSSYLYLDEAHAVGVFGSNGLGLVEEYNLINEVDFILGTFGKAFASVGAFLICDRIIKNYLINKCRSLIYSTALPPINLFWSNFTIEKSISSIGKNKREKLKNLYNFFHNLLNSNNIEKLGNSHIIPIMCYSNELSIILSNELFNKGYYVLPIRPPTVQVGKSRIRISLNSEIPIDKLENLSKYIADIINENSLDFKK